MMQDTLDFLNEYGGTILVYAASVILLISQLI